MKFDSDLSIASSLLSPHRLNRSDIGVGFWQPSQLAGLWQSSGDTIVALGSGNPRAGWTRTLSLFLATSTLLIQDRLQLPAPVGLWIFSGLRCLRVVFCPHLAATSDFLPGQFSGFMRCVNFNFTLINPRLSSLLYRPIEEYMGGLLS